MNEKHTEGKMRKEIIAKIKKGTIMCAAAGAVAISGVAGVASVANAAVAKPGASNIATYSYEKPDEPNTNNTEYTFRNDKGVGYSEFRYKYNTTKVYVYPTVGPSLFYRVFGAKTEDGLGITSRSEHYKIKAGIQGSITNYVHEKGDSYACLKFGRCVKAPYVDTIGWWSPDSTKNYTIFD